MYWTCRVSFTLFSQSFPVPPLKEQTDWWSSVSIHIGFICYPPVMACLHPLRSLTIGQMLIPVEPFPGPLELQNHQTLTHCLWGKAGWDGPESAGCVRSCCECISLFAFGPSKMTFFFSKKKKKERTWRDVWPSMVSHTWNLCSSFYPSKYTHTACSEKWTNTHTANAAAMLPCSRVSPQAQFILLRRTYTPSLRRPKLQPTSFLTCTSPEI